MRTIALCTLTILLLTLAACQNQSPLTGAVVFAVQCSDGSFAEFPTDCPAPEKRAEALQLAPTIDSAIEMPAVIETPIEQTPAPLPPIKKLAQSLLEKAPTNYVYSDGAHIVYASGTKRSTGEWPFAAPGLLYWDTMDTTLNVWVGDVSAHWWDTYKNQKMSTTKRMGSLGASLYPAGIIKLHLTGDKKQDASLIPIEFLKYFQQQYYRAGGISTGNILKLILPYYVKSPLDTFANYASETPLEVDTSDQSINLPAGKLISILSLTFTSKESSEQRIVKDGENTYLHAEHAGAKIKFYFDSHELPVVIDKLAADGTLLDRESYTISSTYERWGVKNTPVDPRIVDLPPHIFITTEDFDAWRDSIEGTMS